MYFASVSWLAGSVYVFIVMVLIIDLCFDWFNCGLCLNLVLIRVLI